MLIEVEHRKELPDGNAELEIIFTYESTHIPKKGDYLNKGGHEVRICDEPIHIITPVKNNAGEICVNMNRQERVRVRI